MSKKNLRLISFLLTVLLMFFLFLLIRPINAQAAGSYGFVAKWGSLGTGNGQFWNPRGIAVNSSGHVYVVDSSNHRVQKFDSSGTFLTKWGSFGAGDGQFNDPSGAAIDLSGNVYVVDTRNHRIQKFDSAGAKITAWGSFGTGDGQFNDPSGVAIDSSGNVYVVDSRNHRVQKFDSAGATITAWGSFGAGDGQFNDPRGVAIDSLGNVYVVDSSNHRVQKFNSSGVFITKWGILGAGNGQFWSPQGVGIDSSGNVYVADSNNHRVQKFNSSGVYLGKWGNIGTGNGEFWGPYGVAVDALGNVYVTDSNNHRVQKFFTDLFAPSTKVRVPRYSTNVSRTRTFRVYWSAKDRAPSSGIALYDVQYKVGKAGGWRNWLMNTKKNSSNFKGRQGKSYYFRARAEDGAGNIGRFSKPKRTIVPYDNGQLIIKRIGFNNNLKKRKSRYYLSTVRYSTNEGDAVSYRFTGNRVAVVSTKARNRSKAMIYIDGKYKRTVNTYSRKTRHRRVIYAQVFRKISRHIIWIVNVGNKDRLDLDALAVGR